LVIGAWGGVVADRVDNRRLLAVTALLGMGQAIGLGVMQATGHVTIHWLYLFAFVLGVVTAFVRPALQAMDDERAGPEDVSRPVGDAPRVPRVTGRARRGPGHWWHGLGTRRPRGRFLLPAHHAVARAGGGRVRHLYRPDGAGSRRRHLRRAVAAARDRFSVVH